MKVNITELRNPYDYANPVRDANLFAGRVDALAKISYILDQAGLSRPVTYLAIHGRRAAGKTSLLNMTEALAKQSGHLAVRVDLVAGNSSPRQFFAKLYEEIVGAVGAVTELKSPDGRVITPRLIRRIIGGQLTDDAFPLEFPESLVGNNDDAPVISEMALRKDLELFVERAGCPIILLVDEAQVIAEQEQVLSVLRTLGMRLRGYAFIIAGTTDLVQNINKVFGPLLRQFELIAVERFIEDADVLNCISLPLLSLGLSPEACLEEIKVMPSDLMRLTDGNPYEVQLYCHAMFARWQDGKTRRMELSPEAIDGVRLMLEAGTDVQRHPMIAKIKALSSARLETLNVMCSSLGHGTLDELWFAHCLPGESSITRENFDKNLQQMISDGIVELVDGRIRFSADQFEEIYLRAWTLKILKQKHPELLSHQDFQLILTRNLEYLLCNIRDRDHRILSTCCNGMRASVLNQGFIELTDLPDQNNVAYTVEYLHEAIVKTGIPSILDVTTVTCSYNGKEAVRWLYADGSTNKDLSAITSFQEAASRVSELGGELSSERTSLTLRPWPEVRDWIIENVSDEGVRREMSAVHATAALDAYSSGEVSAAAEHLNASFRLAKSWQAANNLSYIMLKLGDYEQSLTWSEIALEMPCTPKEKALASYNAAMALVVKGEYANASRKLEAASQVLAMVSFSDYSCAYLFVPAFKQDDIVLDEEPNVNLPGAVSKAVEIVDMVVRLNTMKGLT